MLLGWAGGNILPPSGKGWDVRLPGARPRNSRWPGLPVSLTDKVGPSSSGDVPSA